MKNIKNRFFNGALLSAIILFNTISTVIAQKNEVVNSVEKICNVSSISMNKICKEWDGQWQGMTVASDGNCYFSSSTHSASHGAGFHKYDPRTKKHTVLAEDMTIICSEGNTQSQQGKIHSPIVECDGWLYFSTHLSNYWKEGIERYTGAHVVGFQLATGKFRDLGIVRPRYSVYSAIDVDPVRKKLYVISVPFLDTLIKADGSHLFSIDIATAKKEDLGLLTSQKRGASFWFFVDNKGNCWYTLWKRHEQYDFDYGNLYCYRPDQKKIETYKDVLPMGKLIDGTPVTDEKLKKQRAWTWVKALPGKEKCLFTMGAWGGGDERLWIFDPSKNIETGEAFQDVAPIGSTFLQVAKGGDRLYFIQYANLQHERDSTAETTRDYDPAVVGYTESLHLRSISLKKGADRTITDHGKIVDQDGRAARMINSMTADDKGHVYMYGSWYVKSMKEASFQNLFSEYPGKGIYKLMQRGEFFAVADFSKK